MITLTGSRNSASVMIDQIDDTTRAQIQTFLEHPAFEGSRIAVMPDCHAGKGAVIGFTMALNGFVIPNVIGVDIGCGMLSGRFRVEHVDLPALDRFIRKHIPFGFEINAHAAGGDKELEADIAVTCARIGAESAKALRAVGSLGGGNHFIEVGYDSGRRLWVTVHSGSRNFGLRVAEHHQRVAKNELEAAGLGGKYRDLEYLRVDSRSGRNYLADLAVAQRFAAANRREILRRTAEFLGRKPEETIESVHNFIGDDRVIRKGATPARAGERVIIPFNMRDGLAFCVGKGNEAYNRSAPHGAGRILSRTAAKKRLSVQDFKRTMSEAGVFTTTAGKETLDEAPDAYKDRDTILANIRDTVEVEDFVKPIYNFKAAED